jgi:hypothetical protein
MSCGGRYAPARAWSTVDALTRVNRSVGVGQVMISHTMSDLLALPAEEDRMQASQGLSTILYII